MLIRFRAAACGGLARSGPAGREQRASAAGRLRPADVCDVEFATKHLRKGRQTTHQSLTRAIKTQQIVPGPRPAERTLERTCGARAAGLRRAEAAARRRLRRRVCHKTSPQRPANDPPIAPRPLLKPNTPRRTAPAPYPTVPEERPTRTQRRLSDTKSDSLRAIPGRGISGRIAGPDRGPALPFLLNRESSHQ